MHAEPVVIDVDEVIKSGPIKPTGNLLTILFACMFVGMITFAWGIIFADPQLFWGSFLVSLTFFMGIAAGSVIISAIFQITRAKWCPPVRRLAEVNVAFLPVALVFFLTTILGAREIFPWAISPRPGSELWMNTSAVYIRTTILLGSLFYLMWYFIVLSLKGDLQLAQSRNESWVGGFKSHLVGRFIGDKQDIITLQNRLSRLAPLLVAVYGVIYSFYAFEILMALDTKFMSNLFGAFIFAGNIYVSWAFLAISAIYYASINESYRKTLHTQQLWDLGKLTFGFCMVWGYFFFSQFLPIWYGNLPEETQWMILRLREYPWKGFAYAVFGCCFVFPFITLLSRNLKKSPAAYVTVCLVIFVGIWLQDYLIIMPQFSPKKVPLSFMDLGIFLGFLGLFGYTTRSFLSIVPFVPISHPVTKGDISW
jgi:hypothetical protein